MSPEDPSTALKSLRDALRNPIPDVDTLVSLLERTRASLLLDERSITKESAGGVLKAIKRFLPTIQPLLISSVIPNFLHLLDQDQKQLLDTFFIPETTSSNLTICRAITFNSYLTLPPHLTSQTPSLLPLQCRQYVLDILSQLDSIDQLYWGVWSSSNEDSSSAKSLAWEEAVKACVTLPSKVANAVGRWRVDGWQGALSDSLVPKIYFDRLVTKLELLMYELSQITADTSRILLVIQRLSSIGLFTPPPTRDRTSPAPSFFSAFLPGALAHLHPVQPLPPHPPSYLPSIFLALPNSSIARIAESLLQHLTFNLIQGSPSLEPDSPDQRIRRCAEVLTFFIGKPDVGGEAWEAVMRGVVGRKQYDEPMGKEEHARSRVVVCWVARGGNGAIKALIDTILDSWADPKHIKYTLYAAQFHLTHTLILSLSLLPPYHPHLIALSQKSRFLVAIQSYLGHPDAKIRRLGMLVAEVVSQLTIQEIADGAEYDEKREMEELKAGLEGEAIRPSRGGGARRLDFGEGMWAGDGEGREECRWLRRCLGVHDGEVNLDGDDKAWMLGWDSISEQLNRSTKSDVSPPGPTRDRERGRSSKSRQSPKASKAKPAPKPKIIMLDEAQSADPLEGYTPASPSSSRSPSPTPSYLEEVANDPSLAIGSTQNKKPTKPVYVQQLVALLKEREKPDDLEMSLKWGESLVRAKRSFGTELGENAVNVAVLAIALQDTFTLDGFEEKRQGLLNALVACSPKEVAPFLAEQYFNGQYSLQQRSVILTSLAMGARELAGLTVPTIPTTRRVDFPSKVLPPALHRKYITSTDYTSTDTHTNRQLEEAISGVRGLILHKEARKGEEIVPELAREKRLRVGGGRKTMVAELGSLQERQMPSATTIIKPPVPVIPFKDISAEYFVMPLINRFWQHYQDSTIRDNRAATSGNQYRGAGTGMILSPLALEKFLMTLALLVHASRHSAVFLAVIAPESLELALTIGSGYLAKRDGNMITSGLDDPNPAGGMNLDQRGQEEHQAQVLAASLELALISLDTSFDLDAGRTLVMDKPELVLATGEWAQGVFERENRGERSAGSGGQREGRVRAASAGVVVKVGEMGSRWRL